MKSLLQFIQYNNAIPIAFGILFLGAGGVLAASPAAQDAIFTASEVVRSVDNARITSADIGALPFTLQVVGVTEDDATYHLTYTLETIALVDGVWRDVTESKSLTVAKNALSGEDFGVYAMRQLSEVRDAERSRLAKTQEIERNNGTTAKVVSTEYGGLVGRFFDPTTETFPGYTPVVVSPSPAPEITSALLDALDPAVLDASADSWIGTANDTEPPQITILGDSPVPSEPPPSSDTTSSTDTGTSTAPDTSAVVELGDTVAPVVTLNGDAAIEIAVGDTFTDPGATASDPSTDGSGQATDLTAHINVSGAVNTVTEGLYTLTYTVTDAAGNTGSVSRVVSVTAPEPTPTPGPPPSDTTTI